ncbi:hypothetical protein B0H17DRAFT_1141506 [Mycena rosella]|uniref:DUF6697 domain-containing protein n=1 Tax=Mycena rosella TaxID=1033263 RepID=A0AAD7CZV5_MYCRO|nr:hypothetical protein B0H17DRAFT_1141506 [Mycena rosella]
MRTGFKKERSMALVIAPSTAIKHKDKVPPTIGSYSSTFKTELEKEETEENLPPGASKDQKEASKPLLLSETYPASLRVKYEAGKVENDSKFQPDPPVSALGQGSDRKIPQLGGILNNGAQVNQVDLEDAPANRQNVSSQDANRPAQSHDNTSEIQASPSVLPHHLSASEQMYPSVATISQFDEKPGRPKKRAVAAGGSVSVKKEEPDEDAILAEGSPPHKRPRIFMEAIEIQRQRVSPAGQVRLQPLTQQAQNQVAKLANPIVKIKKELEMCVESVVYRLNAIGLEPFLISLPDSIRRKTTTREWVSKQYGGSSQGSCPPIAREQFKHDMILRFFGLDYNPHLPKNPGDPGLVFFGVGKAYKWADAAEDVFFKAQWCHTIKSGGGGSNSRALRINVDLHRRLKRRPTAAETQQALQSSNTFMHLSETQIDAGFEKGQAVGVSYIHVLVSVLHRVLLQEIAVWTMKCVGYREGLQRKLAGNIPSGWARA